MYRNLQLLINIPQQMVWKKLKIGRVMIYSPETNWLYNHHASITHFKNSFVDIWSDGMKDEDQPGQRVLISISNNFLHWSQPKPLAVPGHYKEDTLNVLTAAGFHQFNDALVAYFYLYQPTANISIKIM